MPTELTDPMLVPLSAPEASSPPTIRSVWLAQANDPLADDMLSWPPDTFAFTDVTLDRAEAYRFAVSPPLGQAWPPTPTPAWREAVDSAAQSWRAWMGEQVGELPELIVEHWQTVRDALDLPLEDIASGRARQVWQALLTLHAIADEACRDVAADTAGLSEAEIGWRRRMRERLAHTGTIARIDPALLRVLPKYRTSAGGITSRSISRYVSVTGPRVQYRVHPVKTSATPDGRMRVLLLPWPLNVSADDFQPAPESIQERDVEPFGYFGFQPTGSIDLALVDRVLNSASEAGSRIDVVVLPESSLARDDVDALETVLADHGVAMLVAGVRDGSMNRVPFASNWVHFGALVQGRWRHYRQDKHHRWSLDRSQIEQYHLAGALDPRVRWWEAIDIKPRAVEMIERSEGHTIASLVCEDLAHIDDVIELLRSVGPTLVIGLLLDGPQLASRWTARYASVLADNPGSAVLTLTSYGMVANAWRPGQPPSRVVALWKENARGLHEISLEPDAQAILLALDSHPAIRRAADGRLPRHDVRDLRIAEVTQLRARIEGSGSGPRTR